MSLTTKTINYTKLFNTKTINFYKAKKEDYIKYFTNTFELYELLFETIQKPFGYFVHAEKLRHPLFFYYGHTASFYINKMIAGGFLTEDNLKNIEYFSDFKNKFDVGVDEMSWDDKLDDTEYEKLLNNKKISEKDYNDQLEHLESKLNDELNKQQKYRNSVKNTILQLIDDKDVDVIKNGKIDKYSFWYVLMMGIEHERIHLETSAVIIQQLKLKYINQKSFFAIKEKDIYNTENNGMETTYNNELIEIKGGEINLGRNWDTTSIYGWDNEFGTQNVKLNDFKVSKFLVSNKEYLKFLKDKKGYSNKDNWEGEEGKIWYDSHKDKNNKYPIFWKKNNKYRTMTQEIKFDKVANLPVIVNYHESKAYCNWLSLKQNGTKYRLISEEEWYLLRLKINVQDQYEWKDGYNCANINLNTIGPCDVNTYKFRVDEQEIYDVIGNVWQNSDSWLKPHNGFEAHELYGDFTLPTYDGNHNHILGGSWISTGNLACQNSRYGFRRHFHQYGGIRYVESNNELNNNPIKLISNDEMKILYSEFIPIDRFENANKFLCNSSLMIDNYKDLNKVITDITKNTILNPNNTNVFVINSDFSNIPFVLDKNMTIYYVTETMRKSYLLERLVNNNEKITLNLQIEGDIYDNYSLEIDCNSNDENIISIPKNNVKFIQLCDVNKDKYNNKNNIFIVHNYIDNFNQDNVHAKLKNLYDKMQLNDTIIINTCYKNIEKKVLENMIKQYFTIMEFDNAHKLIYDTKRKTTFTKHGVYMCNKKLIISVKNELNIDINCDDQINYYETEKALNSYINLHYPDVELDCYPKRCAELCIKALDKYHVGKNGLSMLELGCGLGRTSVQLAKDKRITRIIATDYSKQFIEWCNKSKNLREHVLNKHILSQDKLNKIKFIQMDACDLPLHNNKYDLIFGGNLIDRLPDPELFLISVSEILNDNGILVLTSPYTWLEQYTKKSKWICTTEKDTNMMLKKILGNEFEKIELEEKQIYFLFSESDYIKQSSYAEITCWKKKDNNFKNMIEPNTCGCFMTNTIDNITTSFVSFKNDDMYRYCLENNILDKKLIYRMFKDTDNDNYKDFCLDKNVSYLNNGAFGASFKQIMNLSIDLSKYIEYNPNKYYDRDLFPLIAYSTKKISDYIGSNVTNTALIPNAMYGINSIINSYPFKNDTVIIHFSELYGSIKKTIDTLINNTNIKCIELNDLVITENVIIEKLKQTLEEIKDKPNKMLIVEHISSSLGITFPIKKIIEICKKHNCVTLIDGSHALGNIKLNITELNPDIYITNTHKWFGNIKSASVMYVSDEYKSMIKPLIISANYVNDSMQMQNNFSWHSSNNYTSYIMISKLVDIWEKYGNEILSKRSKIANECLSELYQHEYNELIADKDLYDNLWTIYLPDVINKRFIDKKEFLQMLYANNNIEISIKMFNNRLYMRLSINIYNTPINIEHFLKVTENIIETYCSPTDTNLQTNVSCSLKRKGSPNKLEPNSKK